MKKVHNLSEAEISSLEYEYKHAPKHHFRVRCRAILLSHDNYSVAEISRLLKKKKDTIYSWLNRYESQGVAGLKNLKGQGQKSVLSGLSQQQVDELEEAVEKNAQDLNKVSEQISQKFQLQISKRMLIAYIKKN